MFKIYSSLLIKLLANQTVCRYGRHYTWEQRLAGQFIATGHGAIRFSLLCIASQ